MHFSGNPFAPRIDTPVNTLIHENPSEILDQAVKYDPSFIELPEGCNFVELSLKENRKELMEFINRNHGVSIWKRHLTEEEMDCLIDAGNVTFYGVRWNGLLIACASMEIFDIKVYDKTYKAAYLDYVTIHPKFRNKGVCNVFTFMVYQETVKHGCIMEFFTGHTKINVKPCAAKPSYAYALTRSVYMCGLTENSPHKPFTIRNRTIRNATIEDLKILNKNKEFDVHLTYNDTMLSAMLKYYKVYTNGTSLLCFVPGINILNNIQIKHALLSDWVNITSEFFKEAIEELRKDGFDLISITSEGELKDLTLNIPFEKKEDIYHYTLNILPKTKKGKLNLMVR